MNEDNKLRIKKSNMKLSIGFLTIVIISSVGLFFYNNFLENKNEVLNNEVKNLEKSIFEIQKNKDLQIYNLVSLNKNSIEMLKRHSNITKFINHIKVISSKYNIDFRGFNYNNGILSTSVKLVSDENGLAYNRTMNFIKSYREAPEALFNLNFINNFSGHDRMSFDVKFSVK